MTALASKPVILTALLLACGLSVSFAQRSAVPPTTTTSTALSALGTDIRLGPLMRSWGSGEVYGGPGIVEMPGQTGTSHTLFSAYGNQGSHMYLTLQNYGVASIAVAVPGGSMTVTPGEAETVLFTGGPGAGVTWSAQGDASFAYVLRRHP